MNVLVTGATGIVGRAVVADLRGRGHTVREACRVNAPDLGDPAADWTPAVDGAEAVVHLAALVHVMGATAALADAYQRVNVGGTLRLAAQAAERGVRHFVYMSSIKVHGDTGRLSEDSPAFPEDPYGKSKKDSEEALRAWSRQTGVAVTIVRPPLVYGPGVGANFAALARLVRRGVPLPLGLVRNARSLVGVGNLADFVARCLEAPAAQGQAFLVSDDEDLSTPDLIRRMASVMGQPSRLWPVPVPLLSMAGAFVGRRAEIQRLTGSLTLDISKARRVLDWTPPFTVDHQLRRALL